MSFIITWLFEVLGITIEDELTLLLEEFVVEEDELVIDEEIDVFDFELGLTEETVLQELEEFEVLIEVELFAVHETKNKALSNINDNLFFIFLSLKDLF